MNPTPSTLSLSHASRLAYHVQDVVWRGIDWVPQMLKTITFQNIHYSKLRTQIQDWFEDHRNNITVIDIRYSRLEVQGKIKRTVEIVYEER